MGMVVRTNYSALNSTKHLNLNNKALDKSLEKLSSGYKVNKAADDASGLAISEKMKAQIKALDTASANAEDGISLVQTAEGYIGEIHDMLNRMVELSMKSANGIYQSVSGASNSTANSGSIGAAGVDRDALQLEMDQLTAEIDRIANTANFNNVKLLDGSLSTTGYNKLSHSATTQVTGIKDSFSLNAVTGYSTTFGASATVKATSGLVLQIGETSRQADKLRISIIDFSTAALFNSISTYSNGDNSVGATGGTKASGALSASSGLVQWNRTQSVSGGSRGQVSGFTINISTQASASLAAEALRTVINTVSLQRAQLGAYQNRLDYTINNLNTASENISAANSRIRDTDVAKEMSTYTKNNVLVQAAQSMLAQANQRPQQALQLLG
ncbi:flagellin [Clostridia bacterium]|nr:flagellin [Clostridia bacterium]